MSSEFKTIFDLLKVFPDEQTCINRLEQIRWDGNVISPFDIESKVYKCAGNKYKCKSTGKYFNVKVGTIFEDTKIPLQKWFMALYVFSSHKKGISSHQLGRDIGVTQKSAWFMLHRLRYAFDHPAFKAAMSSIIELDETYVGGKEENKHANKRTEGTQGRSTKTKTPVFGMLERGGNLQAKVVADTQYKTIYPLVMNTVNRGSKIVTDEYKIYRPLVHKYDHQYISHSAKQYVDGQVHTNNLECFWSHLKRGITGIQHWVSSKHLQGYVDEYVLRYNTRKYDTASRFDLVLNNMEGRLTYKNLIA
jgi:transposase-like protein